MRVLSMGPTASGLFLELMQHPSPSRCVLACMVLKTLWTIVKGLQCRLCMLAARARHWGLVLTYICTEQEMMDATLASGAFSGEVEFTGPEEASPAPEARNDTTRAELNWAPKYTSFKSFMLAGAKDFYTESEAFA